MPSSPHILLIHADQHRYDCLGAYGNPDIETPAIDALAGEGVTFEHSFCPFPVCTPSRYSLLSGLYAHQHLGMTNRSTLPAGLPTLPRQLGQAGYATAAVGKMHFTPAYLDVGFQEMWLAEQDGPGRYDDDYHRWLRDEGLVDRLDLVDQVAEYRQLAPAHYWDTYGALRSDLDEAHHSTTWIGERALDVLDRWDDGRPHFLMVGFIKPHHPFDPPAPWHEMYDPQSLSLLPGWTETPIHGDDGRGYFSNAELTEGQFRRAIAYYYATISQIDHHVGRMLDLLRDKGLYERTLIVYTSDHGDFMGYHHRLLKGYRMLEPLVRVPLIVKYPGSDLGGTDDDRLVNNVDLAPTLLAAAGVDVPPTMRGLNLLDLDARREYVFAESGGEVMVRSRTHKLLLHRSRAPMFFDLVRDLTEMENLYGSPGYGGTGSQAEVARLRERLLDWVLFDSQAPNHRDLDAPLCRVDNVPLKRGGSRPYYQARMAEPFELSG